MAAWRRGRDADSTRSNRPRWSRDRGSAGYLALSRRPLHVLLFLLPLILVYEAAAIGVGGASDIVARRLLLVAFESVGVVGLHIPAIVLITVMLCWHVFARHAWRVDVPTLGGLAVESVGWSIPLIVIVAVIGAAGVSLAAPTGSAPTGVWRQVLLSIGAGVYEEAVFRLLLFVVGSMVMTDLLRIPKRPTAVVLVVVSAGLFAAYHGTGYWLVYGAGGAYFAVLYLVRGFGVAVGTHAAYDIIALTALGAAASSEPV